MDKSQPLVGIVLTALSCLLIAGLLSFAGPCEAHADGVSSCYWASRALLGTAGVLLVISVVRIFERDEGERRGLSFAAALLGLLVAALPGPLVGLCSLATMRCNTTMRPFALCLGIGIALVGGTDLTRRLLALRK